MPGATRALWWCPVCHGGLTRAVDGRQWRCGAGHSFDVARQGYVNLLVGGRRRPPGDSADMVAARRAFLATGLYQQLSDAVNSAAIALLTGANVVDVGCGEGYYTRRLGAALPPGASLGGVDVAKSAVALAAGCHPSGCYAVASAFDLPVPPASVDLLVCIFGPVAVEEFARAVRPGGVVLAVHPGPRHLWALRCLVYDHPRPHQVKAPLRSAGQWFAEESVVVVRYGLAIGEVGMAQDLLTMTPYRWHAPRDIDARLTAAGGLDTEVNVVVTSYRRRP